MKRMRSSRFVKSAKSRGVDLLIEIGMVLFARFVVDKVIDFFDKLKEEPVVDVEYVEVEIEETEEVEKGDRGIASSLYLERG